VDGDICTADLDHARTDLLKLRIDFGGGFSPHGFGELRLATRRALGERAIEAPTLEAVPETERADERQLDLDAGLNVAGAVLWGGHDLDRGEMMLTWLPGRKGTGYSHRRSVLR
jgi:hypothetical protein